MLGLMSPLTKRFQHGGEFPSKETTDPLELRLEKRNFDDFGINEAILLTFQQTGANFS